MTKKARTVEDIVRNGGTLKELGLTYPQNPLLPIITWLNGYYGVYLIDSIKWMQTSPSEIERHNQRTFPRIPEGYSLTKVFKAASDNTTRDFRSSPTLWAIKPDTVVSMILNRSKGEFEAFVREISLFLNDPIGYLTKESDYDLDDVRYDVREYLHKHYDDSEEKSDGWFDITKKDFEAVIKSFNEEYEEAGTIRVQKRKLFAAYFAETILARIKEETYSALGLGQVRTKPKDIFYKALDSFGDHAEFRARDRLAATNPRWAILNYPVQFYLGISLAKLYVRIIQRLQEIHDEEGYTKRPIVVLGRDGEMIYQIARAISPTLFKHMIYIIIPRALTSHIKQKQAAAMTKYTAQLKRRIPQNAIVVDTGLEGSIPKYLMKKGLTIKRVALVGSSVPKFAMFPDDKENEAAIALVVDKLEHVPQRLAPVKQPEVWNYSKDAPGFWARYYGILHGMGLPIEPPKATNPYD